VRIRFSVFVLAVRAEAKAGVTPGPSATHGAN